jgi:ribosomal protein S18 acetylase RimI-like enzyme
MPMNVRSAERSEIAELARVWYDAWRDAHAEIVPGELTRLRTLESFTGRMEKMLPEVRVVGPIGAPAGFCMVKDDELDQLFVAAEARGSGAAAALIADGESRLAERGVELARLECAIGNERAARFYEKCGWRRAGAITSMVETSEGTLPLEVWRYEKVLHS